MVHIKAESTQILGPKVFQLNIATKALWEKHQIIKHNLKLLFKNSLLSCGNGAYYQTYAKNVKIDKKGITSGQCHFSLAQAFSQ